MRLKESIHRLYIGGSLLIVFVCAFALRGIINTARYGREQMTTADVRTVLKQAVDMTPDSAIDNSGKSPETIKEEARYRNLMRRYIKEIVETRSAFERKA